MIAIRVYYNDSPDKVIVKINEALEEVSKWQFVDDLEDHDGFIVYKLTLNVPDQHNNN